MQVFIIVIEKFADLEGRLYLDLSRMEWAQFQDIIWIISRMGFDRYDFSINATSKFTVHNKTCFFYCDLFFFISQT